MSPIGRHPAREQIAEWLFQESDEYRFSFLIDPYTQTSCKTHAMKSCGLAGGLFDFTERRKDYPAAAWNNGTHAAAICSM